MAPVHWHKLPYHKFIWYEANREAFRPFLIGGVYVYFYT